MGRNLHHDLPAVMLSVTTLHHHQLSPAELVEAVRASIRPEEIERWLPFGIVRMDGEEYQHLLVNSVIPVTISLTKVITLGEALCQRWDNDFRKPTGEREMCPGCFAIAKAIAITRMSE